VNGQVDELKKQGNVTFKKLIKMGGNL